MYDETPPLTSRQAALLIEEVGQVRRRARSRIGSHTWIGFSIWAGVFAGASLAGPRVFWYWMVAVPVAISLTGVIESRLTWARGIRQSETGYWIIGAAITVLCFGGSFLVPLPLLAAWGWIVLGFGFAGFAILDRHPEAATAMGALGVVAVLAGINIPEPELVYRGRGALFAATTGWIAWRMRP